MLVLIAKACVKIILKHYSCLVRLNCFRDLLSANGFGNGEMVTKVCRRPSFVGRSGLRQLARRFEGEEFSVEGWMAPIYWRNAISPIFWRPSLIRRFKLYTSIPSSGHAAQETVLWVVRWEAAVVGFQDSWTL